MLLYSPAQDEGHIKWPSLRAELAMNLICLRLDRRPDVGAWLVLGVSPNIYKLKATLCGLLCLRKVCPGILVWNGMQFPLGTRLGKCVPLFSWIPGCIFRLRLVGKVRPGLGAQTGMDFPDEGLTKMCPVPGANCGMQFPLAESPLNRKPGWPVFWLPGFLGCRYVRLATSGFCGA